MPTEQKRGKRAGKRGNDFRRSIHAPAFQGSSRNNTDVVSREYAPFWDCADVAETVESHLIPRRSLSQKLHLALFPQEVEYESLKDVSRQQTDSKGQLIATTDPRSRVIWKSDRSLLIQGKPDQFGMGRGTRFVRVTSRSKVRQSIVEVQPLPNSEISFSGKSELDTSETDALDLTDRLK